MNEKVLPEKVLKGTFPIKDVHTNFLMVLTFFFRNIDLHLNFCKV